MTHGFIGLRLKCISGQNSFNVSCSNMGHGWSTQKAIKAQTSGANKQPITTLIKLDNWTMVVCTLSTFSHPVDFKMFLSGTTSKVLITLGLNKLARLFT